MPHRSPLCLTRQTAERFQVLWPDKADFAIHPAESFCFRDGAVAAQFPFDTEGVLIVTVE